MAHRIKIDERLAAQAERYRQAAAEAVEVHARAAQAVAASKTIIAAVAARHGNRLRPPDAASRRTAGPPGTADALSSVFTIAGIGVLRRKIAQVARSLGLPEDALSDFALAMQELMTNAVRHGGGWGRVRLRHQDNLLVCTTTDYGPGFTDGPALHEQMPAREAERGRGLFMARQLTDSMHIHNSSNGVVVTVTMNLPPMVQAPPAAQPA
jgi:serine/threonine-protein kinase RsbW